MSPIAGTAMVIVSSISFGSMAVFARMAYADGVTTVSLLFLRFAAAGLIVSAVVLSRRERLPVGGVLGGLVLMGALGYVGQSLAFFTALTMADAGLVAMLLYLYPAIVALLSRIFLGERLGTVRAGAVVLALFGTFLTIGLRLHARPLGVLLGLSAAFIYSGYIMAGTRLLRKASPLAGSAVIMLSAAAVFGLLTAVSGLTVPVSPAGWLGVGGVAVVATVVAVTTFLIGLSVIGPTRASVLSTFEPLTTVFLASLFLSESISLRTAAGGLCIICAAIILAMTRSANTFVREALSDGTAGGAAMNRENPERRAEEISR